MFFKNLIKKIRTSYRHKLSWYFSVGILIPLLAVFIIGIIFFATQSNRAIDDKLKVQRNLMSKVISDTINSLYNKTFYPINLNTLGEILNTEKKLSLYQALTANENLHVIDNFFPPSSYENLTIYTTSPYLKNLVYIQQVADEDMEQLIKNDNMKAKIEFRENEYHISIYKIYPWSYGEYKHLFCLSVPLSKILSGDRFSLDDEFFVYFSEGKNEFADILVSNKCSPPNLEKYAEKASLSNFASCKLTLPNIGGVFHIFKTTKSENRKMATIIIIFSFVFTAFAVLIIWLVNLLSKLLTHKLTTMVSEIEIDTIKTPANNTNNNDDEFYIIHKKLYDLTNQLKEENERKLKIENELLSQKISPHFLYNNLSVIKWTHNDDKLEEVVDSLIAYYRNIFQKSSSFITLEEELKNLEIYISLLKSAYDQEFLYEAHTEDIVLSECILTNLIQPLIENAFIHSINNSDESSAYIKINIEQTDSEIQIKVINNHCDADTEKLFNTINSDGNSALSIIQKRIRLYYGKDYGLSFEKNNDVLTTTLKLPLDY